jgi:hypothetical protein
LISCIWRSSFFDYLLHRILLHPEISVTGPMVCPWSVR